jgi:outer membrane protein OmpA-like peptidoglycan-associated protein
VRTRHRFSVYHRPPRNRQHGAEHHVAIDRRAQRLRTSFHERLLAAGLPILEKNPDLRVSIDGHTDSSGEAAYNEKLSERRAQAVRDLFIENRIAPSRLEARGFGESRPAAPNDTPENRQLNRRVEFTPL